MQSTTVRVYERGAREVEKEEDPDEATTPYSPGAQPSTRPILEVPDDPKLDWDEDAEQPYFTDEPDRDGHAALMLRAAHVIRPDIEPPEEVPDDCQEDQAYKAYTGENLGGSPCGYIVAPELWLPGDFLFQRKELRGQEVVVGSTQALLANLHGLNEPTFGADPETAARWLSGDAREAATHLEAHARHGFAVLLYLEEEAVARGLPLKLDY